MKFHHERGDDNRANFCQPVHHGRPRYRLPPHSKRYRAMIVGAIVVIYFLVFADWVLFLMSIHPMYSTSSPNEYRWSGEWRWTERLE
jgi:hypothetical protein